MIKKLEYTTICISGTGCYNVDVRSGCGGGWQSLHVSAKWGRIGQRCCRRSSLQTKSATWSWCYRLKSASGSGWLRVLSDVNGDRLRRGWGEVRKATSLLHARGRRGSGASKDSGGEVEMVRGEGEEREWLLWEVGRQTRIGLGFWYRREVEGDE